MYGQVGGAQGRSSGTDGRPLLREPRQPAAHLAAARVELVAVDASQHDGAAVVEQAGPQHLGVAEAELKRKGGVCASGRDGARNGK